MSLIRLILFFVLFYVIYYVIKIFVANFRMGAKKKDNFQREDKSENKYKNVEEAEFTEIKKEDENTKK